jgi:Zn-dependent protease
MTFLVVIAGWIFSLCLHEFSHSLVAYLGGDHTVREKGYLTFNPLKYTHPVYSILVPLIFLMMGGIGLPGGAVYIEKWRLRSRQWASAVSLAGPLSNLLLGVLLALVLRFVPATNSGIWPGLAFLALLQVTAVVLNLIPLPPFDGYGAIEPFLNPATRLLMDRTRGYMVFIIFFVLWYVPVVSDLFWGGVGSLAQLIGVPMSLAGAGYNQFLFWR